MSDALLVSWKEGTLMIPCCWHYTVHILLHCSLLILLVGWGGMVGGCNDRWCVPQCCMFQCSVILFRVSQNLFPQAVSILIYIGD